MHGNTGIIINRPTRLQFNILRHMLLKVGAIVAPRYCLPPIIMIYEVQ